MDTCEKYSTSYYLREELNIFKIYGPKCSNFDTYKARLMSFDIDWNDECPIPAEVFAKAGFLCEGIEDRVTCYNCQIVISDWKINDDVWLEHEKYSPGCLIVLLNRDKIKKRKEKFTEEALHYVDKWMDSNIIQEMLRSGEDVSKIRRHLFRSFGRRELFYSKESFLNEMAEEEEKRKKKILDKRHLCKICKNEEKSVAFFPCGHLFSCTKCAPTLEKCSICGLDIKACGKIYLK